MTHSFDLLQGFRHRMDEMDEKSRNMVEWILDEAVEDANNTDPNYSFESWKENQTEKYDYLEDLSETELKFEFMDDMHTTLDHKDYHLDVIELETRAAEEIVKRILEEERTLGRRFHHSGDYKGELEKWLKEFGYHEERKGYWVKEGPENG